MTDIKDLLKPDTGQPARRIILIDKAGYDDWLKQQGERVRTLLAAQRFRGEAGTRAMIPAEAADDWFVVAGVKDAASLNSWCLAGLAEALPAGTYRLDAEMSPGAAAFGWLTAQYRFARYKQAPKPDDVAGPRVLLTRDVAGIDGVVAEADASLLVRDLVNTPASDLGPAELTDVVVQLGKAHDATTAVVSGDALQQGFPMVHAVGRAAPRTRGPRLVTLDWGNDAHPRIAIVGKGVTFDSGGLNIKPGSGMALMKKDMGGAAHAIALAQIIMQRRLPVRLQLIVAAVENSISGEAMRPGDILTSRNGLTVEIDNTDAEGRLILADALTFAVEGAPAMIINFATLTGAARVALGPDLPALFANDDTLADALIAAGRTVDDPAWRLPLWPGYADMLKAECADITNSPSGGFAGAITAAMFLERFVPATIPWAHFDTFAWRPAAKPGRSKGGAALGLRSCWHMLLTRFG